MSDESIRARIEVKEADITTLSVDAVVNAANESLLGGGGVDGARGERALLAATYRRCLELSRAKELGVIAFPGISTGIYGYPPREAAETAIATIAAELAGHARPARVILCTYDGLATKLVTEVLAAHFAGT